MNYSLLTPAFSAANGILITRFDGVNIYFGMLNPCDSVLKIRIRKTYPEYHCVFSEIENDDFNLKLSQLYSEEPLLAETSQIHSVEDTRQSIIDRVADDAPIVNLLNSIFLEAISKRASDIHIESGHSETSIRYRIDGLMTLIKKINYERTLAISARLKILANLNVLENRRPQDGHIDVRTDSFSLDVRISIIQTIWGESIVLRLLNRSDSLLSLDRLGFFESHLDLLQDILHLSSGLILVTGPTGSGKTTTLAAILKNLDINGNKIISIEDPVEYRIEGITQVQVHEDLQLCFDSILRRIFRQDPDIIMIGEIRDIETAELAIRAALTGHLVFATLHTNNAIEAVYRLQNMGIPDYMLAAVLRMVIAQRLIRKVCQECKSGCINCSHTGYLNRTVIAEFISVDSKLSDLISSGIKIDQMRNYLKQINFKSLFDDANEKVALKLTTESEVRRELGVKI